MELKTAGGKRQLAEWVKATTEGKESLKGGLAAKLSFSTAALAKEITSALQWMRQGRVQTP